MLQRRELNQDKLKLKNCQMCRESILCKMDRNCAHCAKACEGVIVNDDVVGMENRGVLTPQDSRYYALGAFENGAAFKLIIRLLNVNNPETIGRIIVLSETKAKDKSEKSKANLLVMDVANVFNQKNDKTPLSMQLHNVESKPTKEQMKLISGVNVELDAALDEKKRKGEEQRLTPEEIDEAIKKAFTVVSFFLLL